MAALTGGERAVLLLTSRLGDPNRRPLTTAQFRMLMDRMALIHRREADLELNVHDLLSVGFGARMAQHILDLLAEEDALKWYLSRGELQGICPVTRATADYPLILRRRLGLDAPGVLWARGDRSLLGKPAISLVGSRDLGEENRRFAEEAGIQAARQGLVLVSGNARGADKTAQNACLAAGGQVISVVADSLLDHMPRENLLYLSESGFDEGFSAQRALSRNLCIHALGLLVFVAQANLEKGGTWDGTVKNLRRGLSSVACFRDGSEAVRQLEQRGAFLVDREDLTELEGLSRTQIRF